MEYLTDEVRRRIESENSELRAEVTAQQTEIERLTEERDDARAADQYATDACRELRDESDELLRRLRFANAAIEHGLGPDDLETGWPGVRGWPSN